MDCKHEHIEYCANFTNGAHRFSSDYKLYEITICMDCGTIFNFADKDDPMTGAEIFRMFIDLGSFFDGINDAKRELDRILEAIEGLPDRMPKKLEG